jgi:16S rRNA processing protein RimM
VSQDEPQPGSQDGLVELAAVVRSHGLRGELLLKPFNPESDLWDELEHIELKLPNGTLSPRVVESAREHSGGILLALEDVHDRDSADALRGSLVCVRRSVLPELDEGEYYLADLVGLEVRDESGKPVGRVCDLVEYPSVCCLVVETEEGRREVPDVARYVPEVHVKQGFVVVSNLAEIELEKAPERR